MADETHSKRRDFLLNEAASALISLGVAATYFAIETWGFRMLPQGSVWLGFIGTFILTELLLKVRTLWKTLPERDFYKEINKLYLDYPQLKSIINSRISRKNNDFVHEIHFLCHGGGEVWDLGDRLQAANDLCDGFTNIGAYAAISTDAPYLPPSATKEFYDRQARKLPKGKTRRLLVYPIEQLVKELNCPDRFKNVDDFVQLHTKRKFELRFWPHSIRELGEWLNILMGASKSPRLVDYGIIDNTLVFGQTASANDTTSASGRGHIIIRKGEIGHFIAIFNDLWEKTKIECYPAAQLSTLAWLCEMRSRCKSNELLGKKSGKIFFDDTISQIKSSKNLWALDIAEDMKQWWRQSEYRQFLNATTEASKANRDKGKYSRMFLLRRGLGIRSDAQKFIRRVILPQIDAGVEVGIASFDTLVDKNLGVLDCIFDGTGWGFYLLSGDKFSEINVKERHNLIDPDVTVDLTNIYEDIRDVVNESGHLMRNTSDIKEKELVDWLIETPPVG